ncbi:MAG: fibrobacter succinogenes major paralogous domain-containing protein [Bacteroidales bacterium]|nr:fibrobacter succinogenes major paralogous domain-containing protein [Bacteroidales bacterium]MCB9013961.1 fibrobacter succinogenes major paralogous domain-containing protein [Bacteroidales bacterium]
MKIHSHFIPGILGILLLFVHAGCKKEDIPGPPIVVTSGFSDFSLTSITAEGKLKSENGKPVSELGIVWSLSENPDIYANKIVASATTGSFSIVIGGLQPNTKYYFRAFATNSLGTAYGAILPYSTGGVYDADGNSYHIVTIGLQTWMQENLKTTKFNDGSDIPYIIEDAAWAVTPGPSYSWYKHDESSYKNSYGALYNWYAVNSGKLCPEGWHIPSKEEWHTLSISWGDSTNAGGILKETGTDYWISPNTGATNESGFSARPGCFRNVDGSFGQDGYYGYWWTSTTSAETPDYAWCYYLVYNSIKVREQNILLNSGISVRCIKD